ncbi:TIGR04211 family SH3 domain-containing protein [Sedimenticola selenatireducens]|uniref:TIGR04211 family SH3 domain-containing protein n=1 Tax=Sedimenticola selenatireducens TaxID=191960 RepID=A0A558DTX7_9GAMM|nr:TIGR04211 family SH3 domain-containing protein [Sedimenticola selenatireducens]TVO76910.1 TIGR04211 family SH3 domain-containing protein [Sedimenticola selenatireducens]TVT64353.1 MAG: TIGR04211 family SH3 domain-containing protein [Sedimenticola selenatireducens]
MTRKHLQKLIIGLLIGLLIGTAQAARITDKLLAGLYDEPDATTAPIRVVPSDTPLERLEKQGDFTKVRLGDGTEGWVESRFITDEKPARIMLLELQVKNSELQQKLREANKELSALGQTETDANDTQPDPEIAELKRQLADAKAEIDLLKREVTPPAAQPDKENEKLKQQVLSLEQALEASRQEAKAALEQAKQIPAVLPAQPAKSAELVQMEQTNLRLQQQLDQIAQIVRTEHSYTDESPAMVEQSGIRLNAWHLPVILLALLLSFIGGVAFKNYRLAKRYGGFRI